MNPEAPMAPAHLATPALRALHYWTPGPQKAEATIVSTKHAAPSPVASPGRAKMRENAAGSRIPVTATTATTAASESEGGAITADITITETTMLEADIASEAAMVEAFMAKAALANPEVTKQPLFRLLDYSKKLEAHLKKVRALNDQMKAVYLKNPTRNP